MNTKNGELDPERFIALSREYVDDVMENTPEGKKVTITKEHYYIFAISNFIATKEYFLKKGMSGGSTIIKFNASENEYILHMIIEFYEMIKPQNSYFRDKPLSEIQSKIQIDPGNYSFSLGEEETAYFALDLFNDVRNALSHPGNYKIIEANGENLVLINSNRRSNLVIPIELFDFVAFYINSYKDGTSIDEIHKNYLIYKKSKDNERYYKFESGASANRIIKLLSKTQIRTKQKNIILSIGGVGHGKGGSSSPEEEFDTKIYEYIDELKKNLLDELEKNCDSEFAAEIEAKIDKLPLEYQLELLVEYDVSIKSSISRVTSDKIDKCLSDIMSLLKLDRKSSSLYSHSIILFSNRSEPQNTNAQDVISKFRRIRRNIVSIEIGDVKQLDSAAIKEILENYKKAMEALLENLPNLMRIREHQYRNSVFHNNVEFIDEKLHFWNQKDNSNPNDIHTFDISMVAGTYDLELKSIEENYKIDIRNLTIKELFEIIDVYDEDYEMRGKLWCINSIYNGLFTEHLSINDLMENLNKKIKELSSSRGSSPGGGRP